MASESQNFKSGSSPSKIQEKLLGYQRRDEELLNQLIQLRESRDEAQASSLLQK